MEFSIYEREQKAFKNCLLKLSSPDVEIKTNGLHY